MSKGLAIGAGAAVAALLVGTFAFTTFGGGGEDDIFAECRTSNAAGADIGGPFELVSETGETVTSESLITGPTLLYFGYTFCPDVCPLDNMRNALAIHELDERGIDVLPVFISIDPDRDTPELLADFTDNFHPRMMGLTGTPEQVRAASQAYKTYYQRQEGDDEYYLVDHTTMSYLVFPEHGFQEFYRRDMTPEDMADNLQCFVEAAQAADG